MGVFPLSAMATLISNEGTLNPLADNLRLRSHGSEVGGRGGDTELRVNGGEGTTVLQESLVFPISANTGEVSNINEESGYSFHFHEAEAVVGSTDDSGGSVNRLVHAEEQKHDNVPVLSFHPVVQDLATHGKSEFYEAIHHASVAHHEMEGEDFDAAPRQSNVPEPSSFLLMVGGMAGGVLLLRRRLNW